MASSYSRRYQQARTLIEEIFGAKMHQDFPRKLMESASCGDGFWETDGKGQYSHKGIMLNVTVGNEVTSVLEHFCPGSQFDAKWFEYVWVYSKMKAACT